MASNILWWDKFFSNSINIIFSINIIMFHSLFSFDHLLFFIWLFYLSTRFFCFLTCLNLVQSWIFCVTFHLVPETLMFVPFWTEWMLVTINILKYMANHGSQTLQITHFRSINYKNFFSLSNEIGAVLITGFFVNKYFFEVC